MIKGFFLMVVMIGACLLTGKAHAVEPGTHLEVSPQVGVALPGQGNFSAGLGAALFVGARTDDLSLGVQTAIYSFNYSLPSQVTANVTGGFSMLEFVALLKKRFGAGSSYFLVNLGAGGALYSDNATGTFSSGYGASGTINDNFSEFDPLLKVSIGLGFKLSPSSELYFDLGPDIALSNGGRLWILPAEAGLNFF